MKLVSRIALAVGLISIAHAGPRGTLEYGDGNRVTGELVESTAKHWVFQADRFGELKVPRGEATFLADTADAGAQLALPQQVTPVTRTQTQPDADKSADSTHPWWRPHSMRGNLYGVLSEDDGNSKREGGLEFRSVWAPLGHDELRWEARWIDKKKNGEQDDLRTTLDTYWRIDLDNHWFAYLGNRMEWDEFDILNIDRRYFLGRDQGGLGYAVVNSDTLQSRVAMTWNYFRFESDAIGLRFSTDTPSLMIENELLLPWGIKLHQIGQVYYWQGEDEFGVDNEIEITKALGKHWHIGTRHEWRENAADITLFPFSKWRLFMGLSY